MPLINSLLAVKLRQVNEVCICMKNMHIFVQIPRMFSWLCMKYVVDENLSIGSRV